MKSINPSGSRKSSKPTGAPPARALAAATAAAFLPPTRTLLKQGQVQEAIDHFRAALRLEPGVAEIHESLGRALALQGKNDEAAAHLEEAVRILKTSPPAP
jgi:Flp pilus assembly protein TadD